VTLVSIITPSYNQAAYLEQTIQSVLNQDYAPIEYFIVDGGSTDGSLDIIHKYQDQLTWWVSEPDKGQADAINKGLARANGDIVGWLNSDDYYQPGAIKDAAAMLVSQPALGMVFGDAITVDQEGKSLNKLIFGDWGLKELMAFRIICQPAVFMRHSIQKHTGGLDKSYHYLLDHQLWIRIAQQAPILHVPRFWAAARHHTGAKNVAEAGDFGQEVLRIYEWMTTDPDLAPLVEQYRNSITAGAYRLNGRYLLDGGKSRQSLQSYRVALRADPIFTLRHWHRMIYAVLSLIGGKGLSKWYYQLKTRLRKTKFYS